MASTSASLAFGIDIKPGELEGLINNKTIGSGSVVLTGAIDARDLAAIENLPSDIVNLDLKDIRIQQLTLSTRKYFGKTLFAEGELPSYTFFKSGLETLLLPTSVKTIGEGAFSASSLKSLEIPEGVTKLGDYAFYGCEDLESVTLPSTLKELGKGVFGNCHQLKYVNFSSGCSISELPEKTFAGCVVLESVNLPATITKVGREAFTHTMIRELNLDGVTEFEDFALSGMPYLQILNINPQVAEVTGLLMDDISLVSLTGVPENLPDYFAANCTKLPTNDIVSGISTIGKYALANQEASNFVILGTGIVSLDRGAFSGNTLIAIDVTALHSEVPAVTSDTFEGISQKDVDLIVNDGDEGAWEADPVWRLFNIKTASATVVGPGAQDTTEGVTIRLLDDYLMVESGNPIVDIRIFSTDGKLLLSKSPNDNIVSIPTSDLASGVVVVKAVNENKQSKSATVMLK